MIKVHPKVVIIILNYKRTTETIECLESVLKSSYKYIKIIVVDSESTGSKIEQFSINFNNVEVIKSSTNLGYTGGMNLGLKHALNFSPEYIYITNSDTFIHDTTIEILMNALESNSAAAMATGTIYYYPQIEKIWYAGGNINYIRASGFQATKMDKNINDTFKSVSFISGCACMISARALREVGLFDERFFLYQEDVELSARMIQRGYKLLYVPEAKIYHRLDNAKRLRHTIYYGFRNRLLFTEISAHGFQKIMGFSYLFIVILLKLIYWRIFNNEYFHAALAGVVDYFARRFSIGRGFVITEQNTSNGI